MSDASSILYDLRMERFSTTHHARMRMRERNIAVGDLIELGFSETSAVSQQDSKTYKIQGDELTAIVAYDGETLVITAFWR